MSVTRRSCAAVVVGMLGLALAHCGGDGERAATSGQAILGGSEVDAPDSPVLYLRGPEGGCSAVLVAPNLAVTARHCVAQNTPGAFSCTASGHLVGNGVGQIGADDAPATLAFFTSQRAAAGAAFSGAPDAIGNLIVSTQTPTACRDDLAFVILDRALPGRAPAIVRLRRPTSVDELVSVWGYGLTDQVARMGLRTRQDARVLGVGPDLPSDVTQPAPVRSLRLGPVTCQGDSGGPVMSESSGAVIAIVSLGSQAGTNGPFCNANQQSDTIAPRLAAYRDLALLAFRLANASPLEEDSAPDAAAAQEDSASPSDSAATPDAAPPPDGVSEPDPTPPVDATNGAEASLELAFDRVTGGSCTMTAGRPSPRSAIVSLATAWMALAGRRRRR